MDEKSASPVSVLRHDQPTGAGLRFREIVFRIAVTDQRLRLFGLR